MLVLAIETAGGRSGAALWRDGGPLTEVTFNLGRRQGELLAPAALAALRLGGVTPGELGLIAVDVGPGSFTGLRIGVAFAKALAQSLAIPVVGVRQTEAVGLSVAQWWPGRVAVWIHDRGQFLYTAWVEQGRVGGETVLPAGEAVGRIRDRGGILVVGTGALRFAEEIKVAAPRARVAGELWAHPSPAEVARLGLTRFLAQGPVDPLALEPHYVQAPMAGG